ncbi:hypothetical protein BC567DRAFT_296697 [Phyllosticta citribraziliensis]
MAPHPARHERRAYPAGRRGRRPGLRGAAARLAVRGRARRLWPRRRRQPGGAAPAGGQLGGARGGTHVRRGLPDGRVCQRCQVVGERDGVSLVREGRRGALRHGVCEGVPCRAVSEGGFGAEDRACE